MLPVNRSSLLQNTGHFQSGNIWNISAQLLLHLNYPCLGHTLHRAVPATFLLFLSVQRAGAPLLLLLLTNLSWAPQSLEPTGSRDLGQILGHPKAWSHPQRFGAPKVWSHPQGFGAIPPKAWSHPQRSGANPGGSPRPGAIPRDLEQTLGAPKAWSHPQGFGASQNLEPSPGI